MVGNAVPALRSCIALVSKVWTSTLCLVLRVELSKVRVRIELYFGSYSGAGARGRDSARLRWLTLFQ